MRIKSFITLLIILIIFPACSKPREIDKSKRHIRNNLIYCINEEKPFTGKIIEKYKNGQKQVEVEYKDGKLNGKTIKWHENGEIKSEEMYKNGVPIE